MGKRLTIEGRTGQTLVAWLLVWAVGVGFPLSGWGADRLNDSQSPRQTVNLKLRWAHQADSEHASNRDLRQLIAVASDVEVRLDTMQYVGKDVRIYLALPIQINGLSGSDGLTLSWQTRGALYPGSTTPGNRFLIFKGRLDVPQLIESFKFKLTVDANRLTGKLRYAPIFEIEPN